jgi:hypothetical protein
MFRVASFPWFKRGDNYDNGSNAGAFNFNNNTLVKRTATTRGVRLCSVF